MTIQKEFYVRLTKDGQKYKSHQISWDNNFDEKPEENNEENAEVKEDPKDNGFHKIHAEFSNSMFGYNDILPLIATFAPLITQGIQQKSIATFLNKNCIKKVETDKNDDYTVSLEKFGEFKNIIDSQKTSAHVSKQVPKMLTIGIVSSLEHHIVLLMREILKVKPYIIEDSEKSISIKDVFGAGGTEKFKEKMIEKEIDGVMRSNIAEQIKWVERHTDSKSPISKNYDRWDQLLEIVERRNLFVHANGVVNDIYIENTKGLEFERKSKVQIGDELKAGPEYFSNVIDVILEFGIKLTQVIWRKLFPDSSIKADTIIGDFGFKLIERGQYELALRILIFATTDLKGAKEVARDLINKINLANCHKLLGEDKKCEILLAEEDWASKSDNFLICSMAIRGDAPAVAEKMSALVHNEDWDESNYEQWPVFYHVRDDECVKTKFQEIYGRTLTPMKKTKNSIEFLEHNNIDEVTSNELNQENVRPQNASLQ